MADLKDSASHAPRPGREPESAADRTQEELVERLIAETQAFVDFGRAPDFAAGVLRRIAEQRLSPAPQQGALRRLAASLWAPRQVSLRLRPVYGLAAAAALAVGTWIAPSSSQAPSTPDQATVAVETPSPILVQFRLDVNQAADVRLVGSFTNWQDQYELQQTGAGVWTVTVPLTPGVYDYMFIVDGHRWMPDPNATQVSDGFGGVNSRMALLAPGDRDS